MMDTTTDDNVFEIDVETVLDQAPQVSFNLDLRAPNLPVELFADGNVSSSFRSSSTDATSFTTAAMSAGYVGRKSMSLKRSTPSTSEATRVMPRMLNSETEAEPAPSEPMTRSL